jgi:hypothetical protein
MGRTKPPCALAGVVFSAKSGASRQPDCHQVIRRDLVPRPMGGVYTALKRYRPQALLSGLRYAPDHPTVILRVANEFRRSRAVYSCAPTISPLPFILTWTACRWSRHNSPPRRSSSPAKSLRARAWAPLTWRLPLTNANTWRNCELCVNSGIEAGRRNRHFTAAPGPGRTIRQEPDPTLTALKFQGGGAGSATTASTDRLSKRSLFSKVETMLKQFSALQRFAAACFPLRPRPFS